MERDRLPGLAGFGSCRSLKRNVGGETDTAEDQFPYGAGREHNMRESLTFAARKVLVDGLEGDVCLGETGRVQDRVLFLYGVRSTKHTTNDLCEKLG